MKNLTILPADQYLVINKTVLHSEDQVDFNDALSTDYWLYSS